MPEERHMALRSLQLGGLYVRTQVESFQRVQRKRDRRARAAASVTVSTSGGASSAPASNKGGTGSSNRWAVPRQGRVLFSSTQLTGRERGRESEGEGEREREVQSGCSKHSPSSASLWFESTGTNNIPQTYLLIFQRPPVARFFAL